MKYIFVLLLFVFLSGCVSTDEQHLEYANDSYIYLWEAVQPEPEEYEEDRLIDVGTTINLYRGELGEKAPVPLDDFINGKYYEKVND